MNNQSIENAYEKLSNYYYEEEDFFSILVDKVKDLFHREKIKITRATIGKTKIYNNYND
jgi:hypothetical protein